MFYVVVDFCVSIGVEWKRSVLQWVCRKLRVCTSSVRLHKLGLVVDHHLLLGVNECLEETLIDGRDMARGF